jgi:hypothetical protein
VEAAAHGVQVDGECPEGMGWRKLNGFALLPEVIRGVKFADGEKVTKDAA